MASAFVKTIFSAVDKFSKTTRIMSKSVQSFASKSEVAIARSSRAFRRLTPNIGSAAKQFLSFASAAAITTVVLAGINFTIQGIKNYETALASAQAITGTTNKEFALFKTQIEAVAKETKKSAVNVAKAFELVGSAQPELLKNADALGLVTKAAITLSKASGDDLAVSAESLTGVMNQFGLSADQAARTMNVLAAGSVVGSANITSVGESMKNFGAVASGANLSLEESVALVEVMGKFSVKGAEAGTKLRGSILKLQKANVGYASGQFKVNDALLEAKKKVDGLATAQEKDRAILKIFGAENVSTGKILLNNIGLFNKLTKGVTGTNIANEQAAINSSTLTVALEEASAAWLNMVVTSGKATSALNTVKRAVQFVTRNLDTIVSVGTKILLFFVAWKALLLASAIVMGAYNIGLGIMGALSGTASIAIGANTIALGAYKFALGIATFAQWLWNAAMLANPIGLIILGVAALIALVTIIIVKYNEWGAALAFLMGPIGMLINLVQSFRRNWALITESFATGGIVSGIIAIGKTIADSMLMPLQQLLELVSKIDPTGFAASAASKIADLRAKLGVTVINDESKNTSTKEAINPKAAEQEALAKTIESTNNAKVSIDVNDPNQRTKVTSDSDIVKILTSSTLGLVGQ